MDKKKLFSALAEVWQIPESDLTEKTVFGRENWDSLALLAIAAAIDEYYDTIVSVKELSQCDCVKDIIDLIEVQHGEMHE